jgi:hypothetical protein
MVLGYAGLGRGIKLELGFILEYTECKEHSTTPFLEFRFENNMAMKYHLLESTALLVFFSTCSLNLLLSYARKFSVLVN